MEEKTVTGLFDEMKCDVTNYVTNTIEIVKLETFEKASKATAATAFTLVLMYFVFLVLGLALFTLAFYLAEVLNSTWKGFGAVTLGAILITFILVLIKKPIKKTIVNTVIHFLQRAEDEDVKYTTKS